MHRSPLPTPPPPPTATPSPPPRPRRGPTAAPMGVGPALPADRTSCPAGKLKGPQQQPPLLRGIRRVPFLFGAAPQPPDRPGFVPQTRVSGSSSRHGWQDSTAMERGQLFATAAVQGFV